VLFKMTSLTAVVDRLAAEKPQDLWVKAPGSSDGEADWHDVTWLQLARAVDAMAHWMETHLGSATENEPVAYMAIGDIRYPIVILAAMKTGYKVSFESRACPHRSLAVNEVCKRLY
jgi:acyl-CoA synthetase (AMP-forming)/AMP-acid ligase II